jgi:large subunit ribosomal protein L28
MRLSKSATTHEPDQPHSLLHWIFGMPTGQVCVHAPLLWFFSAVTIQDSGVYVMAQICDICGKGPQFGNNISHAHNVSRRRWNVNLQAVKALVNGAPKRIRVCTSCIKSGKITKA